MDTNKISIGEMIAGASAFALFLFMFLPWYGLEASTSVPGGSDLSFSGADANAWEAFSFIDILLFLVVIVSIGIVVAKAAGSLPELPQPPAQILLGVGVLALLLVLFRLIFTPGEDVSGFGVEIELTRKIGVFFGLLASAGIAYGGWRATSEPAVAGPSDRVGSPPPPAPAASTPPPPATPAGGGTPAAPPERPAPATDPTPPTPPPADPVPPAAPVPPADPVPPAPPADPTPPATPPAEPERPAPPAGGQQPPSGGQPPYGGPSN